MDCIIFKDKKIKCIFHPKSRMSSIFVFFYYGSSSSNFIIAQGVITKWPSITIKLSKLKLQKLKWIKNEQWVYVKLDFFSNPLIKSLIVEFKSIV